MATVLLVDDDESIALLIEVLCGRMAVSVDHARDGEIAVSRLRARRYDAVLLDLMLPTLNGFEVLREMRSFAPAMLARTIVITAASDATLRDFDGGGTHALLRKPFDIDELRDALASCLGIIPGPRVSSCVVRA